MVLFPASRTIAPTLFLFLATATALPGCRNSAGPEDSVFSGTYLHIRASWSPDGTTIAFRGDCNGVDGIHLVDSSGANRRLLQAGDGLGFTWSPDSRWLAFSSVGTLYKILANGDSLTQITFSTRDLRPNWSPDGTRIAFVRTGIWLLDLDSLTTRQLSPTGNYPAWHPNGVEVVVLDIVRQVSEIEILYAVDAINAGTGESRSLYTFESPDNCTFGSISPDGGWYLFAVQPPQGLSQVWAVDLSTRTPVRLTDDGGDYPAWSPDGTQIVYTRTAEGDGTLWVMRRDGSGKRRLTTP